MDTLEYLRKGGRLGLVAAIVERPLKLKPIISCNEAGVYYIAGKALGRGKSLDRMLNLATAFAASKEGSQVALLNGDAPREALGCSPGCWRRPCAKSSWLRDKSAPLSWSIRALAFWALPFCGVGWTVEACSGLKFQPEEPDGPSGVAWGGSIHVLPPRGACCTAF